MIRFWDSSGIVSLIVHQRHSPAAEAMLEDDAAIAVWWATPVECASALARLLRDGHLDPEGAYAATRRLQEIAQHWIEIEPTVALRETALEVVARYSIRAADALQLAAAKVLGELSPEPLEFVTFDARLGAAARHEGFRIRGATD